MGYHLMVVFSAIRRLEKPLEPGETVRRRLRRQKMEFFSPYNNWLVIREPGPRQPGVTAS